MKGSQIKHSSNFTVVGNEAIQNPNLSAKAKGLFVYLLSLPNDWIFYERELVNHFSDGKSSISSALRELKENGYVTIKKIRDENGRFMKSEWFITESPVIKAFTPETENPETGNRDPENRCPENRALQNTNITKDLYNKRNIERKSKESLRATDVAPHSENKQFEAEFEKLWSMYPNKKGKKAALNHYKKWRKESKKHTAKYLKAKLQNYNDYIANNHVRPQYVLNGSTWFNGRFEDELTSNAPKAPKNGGYSNLGGPAIDVPDDELPF